MIFNNFTHSYNRKETQGDYNGDVTAEELVFKNLVRLIGNKRTAYLILNKTRLHEFFCLTISDWEAPAIASGKYRINSILKLSNTIAYIFLTNLPVESIEGFIDISTNLCAISILKNMSLYKNILIAEEYSTKCRLPNVDNFSRQWMLDYTDLNNEEIEIVLIAKREELDRYISSYNEGSSDLPPSNTDMLLALSDKVIEKRNRLIAINV